MRDHHHITRQILRAARRGHITEAEFAELLALRLASHCPACRRELERFAAEEIPRERYREAVAHALSSHDTLRAREEAKQADEAFARLEPLSPEQRLLRIRNAPDGFASKALGQLVLDRSRACLPNDCAGSLAWAETAAAVAAAYLEPYPPHEIRALALEGNAHRALGDFDRAETLLRQAWSRLYEHRVTDLGLRAELSSFLGSLASDRNLLDEAADHLHSAARLYESLGDTRAWARVLINLGSLHAIQGDLQAAIKTARAVLRFLTPEMDEQLSLAARLNCAFYLQEAGRPVAARDTLDLDLTLFQEATSEHIRVRVHWLRARLAADEGKPAEAERGFLEVRDTFAEQQHGFNAALVGLELAALYHEQGRFEDVEEVAAQTVELFQAYALHQRALSALILLHGAARARTLTAQAIERAAEFLRRASRDQTDRARTAN